MNINNILEKYWNSEASLQEEAELRAYFSGDDVAPEHIQYQDLFTFFAVSRLQTTDLDVDQVLSSLSDIDLILEKYWNAETSLEDEAQLKAYFSGDAIAPEHKQYADLFTFYNVSQSLTTDMEFDQGLNSSDDIDGLLEKYWNAETSLEDEKVLKRYFGGNQVALKHESYKDMFSMFSEKSTMTSNLDIKKILTESENNLGSRAIGSTEMPKASRTKVFSLQKWATSMAAIFVIGFAAITLMNQESTPQYKGQTTVLDSEADAQEAYEITKEALAFLSKNMNTGSKTVVESVSKAEKVSIFK